MRAPEFWSNRPDRPGWRARLLSPLGALYAAATRARRRRATPYRVRVPVVCVGNLVVGGAGKTPTVQALCARLTALGLTPHVLSRGYGGKVSGVKRVDLARDRFEDVGDEPLLLAQHATVWVGRDRVASARAAVAAGAKLLLMDDGYQNPSLEKDLSILVIDAGYGHGNGRVMPAGPLRESLSTGFDHADAVIMIGEPPDHEPWPYTPPGLPVLHARLSPQTTGLSLNGRRVVAFAGIGRPEKFFSTLREMGAKLIETHPFPDHHAYSNQILRRLETLSEEQDAVLLTTEKDAVRLPSWFRGRYTVAPVTLGFEEPEAIDALLSRLLR